MRERRKNLHSSVLGFSEPKTSSCKCQKYSSDSLKHGRGSLCLCNREACETSASGVAGSRCSSSLGISFSVCLSALIFFVASISLCASLTLVERWPPAVWLPNFGGFSCPVLPNKNPKSSFLTTLPGLPTMTRRMQLLHP